MGMTEVAAAAWPTLGGLMASADAALPQTGRAIPLLAAGIAIGVALLLRLGGWKLGAGDAHGESEGDESAIVEAGAFDEAPDPGRGTGAP